MIALRRSRHYPIGIQLGPQSATVMQMAENAGRIEVHSMAHGELPRDENTSTEQQDRETASALRKLIADHHFKSRQVVSCLGSQELFVQNVRLPQLPPEEVDKVVNWEAEERLPYPVCDAEIRHLRAGQVRQDANIKQEVILLACHRGVIERHIGVLAQAGLMPIAIDVEPCAVLRCLRHNEDGASAATRCAYLNFDETATTVIFAEGDQILFLKYVASGGQHLDQAVAKHLNLNVREAAKMRSTVTTAAALNPQDEVHRSVIEAIRDPLEAVAAEIELCVRYFKVTFRGKPLQKIVVTGSEASRWLVEFLSERLGTGCSIGNPFESLKRWPTEPAVLECPWRWTAAMGLSMRSFTHDE